MGSIEEKHVLFGSVCGAYIPCNCVGHVLLVVSVFSAVLCTSNNIHQGSLPFEVGVTGRSGYLLGIFVPCVVPEMVFFLLKLLSNKLFEYLNGSTEYKHSSKCMFRHNSQRLCFLEQMNF